MSKSKKSKRFIGAVSCSLLLIFLESFFVLPGYVQGSGKPVWGYKPERIRVDDSFSFIYHRDRTSSITVLKLFVRGGKKAEPNGQKGLAYVTSALCTSLPEHWDRKRLQMLGSTFYALVNDDYSVISIESLSEYLDVTLDLVLKSIKKPVFSHSRIKQLKKNLEYFQKEEMDEPYHRMKNHFADIFFPGTAYSGSLYGTPNRAGRCVKR
jgi:zinc protease